jgi:hypothetical protein
MRVPGEKHESSHNAVQLRRPQCRSVTNFEASLMRYNIAESTSDCLAEAASHCAGLDEVAGTTRLGHLVTK